MAFTVCFDNFKTSMFATFNDLRKQKCFTDVHLSCGKYVYNVHKVVLAACSPFFKRLLKDAKGIESIIVLNDVSPDLLEHILNYMYTGQVTVNEKEYRSFLSIGKQWQVIGLIDDHLQKFNIHALK